MKNLISVIIPAYNAASTIRQCIDSVLAQTYPDIEVIVVDDGSSDSTANTIKEHYKEEKRVHYYAIKHTGREGAVRNYGIQRASGAYISFLDADDYWEAYVIEYLKNALDSNPDCNIAYGDLEYVGGQHHGTRVHDLRTAYSGYVFYYMLQKNFMPIHPALLRNSIIDECGGFDESIEIGPDYEFWLRMTYRNKVIYCAQAIGYYRISDSSVFHRADAIKRNMQLILVMKKIKSSLNVAHYFLYKRLAVAHLTIFNHLWKEKKFFKCCYHLMCCAKYSILYYIKRILHACSLSCSRISQ